MNNDNKTLIGTIWASLGLTTLFSGLSVWSFIAASTVIAGTNALLVFAGIVISSAVGIGGMVGYCTMKALEAFAIS